MYRGITLLGLTLLLLGMASWQPQSGFTSARTPQIEPFTKEAKQAGKDQQKGNNPMIQPKVFCHGTGTFTNGTYDCNGSTYYYNVTGGPAYSCGELHIIRNGSQEVTPCWLTTDAYGNATKGPWTVSTNQTGEDIFIQWPDGSQTCGGDSEKVDDATAPTIGIDQSGGSSIPTAFSGTANDTLYGSGFSWWTNVTVTFRELGNLRLNPGFWDGSCYCDEYHPFYASFSPSSGYSVNWSITPPPPEAHQSGRTYRWCVEINDKCFSSGTSCITFTAP